MNDDPHGNTPIRRFRCEDHWWNAGMTKARTEGTTISAKIRGWIIAYVQEDRA